MDLSYLTETCVDALCAHVSEAMTFASRSPNQKKPCGVVVDPSLASLFAYASPSLVPSSTSSMFLRPGAMREFVLNEQELDWREDGPLVFYLRPNPQTCRLMALQIRTLVTQSRIRPDLRAVFIPRRSFRCEDVLKQENVLSFFTQGIHAVSLGFVNIEPDVLSMEMKNFLRETRVDGDTTAYTFAARALLDLGPVPYSSIRGKGFATKEVLELYRRMRMEAEESRRGHLEGSKYDDDDVDSHASSSHHGNSNLHGLSWLMEEDVGELESENFRLATQLGGPLDRLGGYPRPRGPHAKVDTILVLDRELDMISPLLTPLTYESLLDESFNGIRPGFLLDVKSSILRLDEDDTASDVASSIVTLDLKDDVIFRLIRMESVLTVMQTLNQHARELKEEQERIHRITDPQELQLMVQRVPELQQKKRKLATHIALCQKLTAMTLERRTRATIDAERKLVFDSEPSLLLERAQDSAARGESILKVLRQLCLTCIVSGGFSSSQLDEIRRDVIHAYGFETVLSLEALERVGMLAPRPFHPQHRFAQAERARQGKSAPSCIYTNWDVIKREFRLAVDEASMRLDPAYVFSGVAPLSVRLVEMEARQGGWSKHTQALSLLGESPTYLSLPTSNKTEISTTGTMEKKVLVVFYLGGVSRAEIAALRFVASRPDCAYRIIIATTDIVNGTQLIKSCCHPSLFPAPTSTTTTTRKSAVDGSGNPFA